MENQISHSEDRFSDIYLRFTQLYSQTYVREEEKKLRIPEKVVRCIWNDQLFKTRELQTTSGEQIEIMFPGFWNFGKGPDFAQAIIKINDKTFSGDVELHVYSGDWKTHEHSKNPDYDNVVLHVFMWKNRSKQVSGKKTSPGPARTLPGAHIFELELKGYLAKGILEIKDNLEFDNYPVINTFNYGLCHEPLARLPLARLANLLNAAGDARILTKMNRFHDRVIIKGYEQAFYEGLAEALGYPSNKKQFQTLAESVPLATLRKIVPAEAGAREKAEVIQAVLLGVSGLLRSKPPDIDVLSAGDRAYFETMEKIWKNHKSRFLGVLMKGEGWNFFGMRPANYPYRRIAGLSHLLVRHWGRGMFADFMEQFKSTVSIAENKGYTTKILKPFYGFYCIEAEDYWSTHYIPGGKGLAFSQQLVGPTRSREIAINIMIPLGLIYARASKSTLLEKALKVLYQSRKNPGENKSLRFMKRYILGDKEDMIHLLETDKQTQGLLQVYQDFCTQNENNCLKCPFPGVIEKYFS